MFVIFSIKGLPGAFSEMAAATQLICCDTIKETYFAKELPFLARRDNQGLLFQKWLLQSQEYATTM